MYGIDILVDEHKNIKRMAAVMRNASLQAMQDGEICVADFDDMKDFVRNYADDHHHKKEEKVLFQYMQDELGKVAENLITHGMLVEHDLGRLHMMELDKALREYEKTQSAGARLDIIANATGYTYLIHRHIDKEDAVVYTFAANNLKDSSKQEVDRRTKELEKNAKSEGIPAKYMVMLERLEQKYC